MLVTLRGVDEQPRRLLDRDFGVQREPDGAAGEAFRAPARRHAPGQLAKRVHANLRRISTWDGGWLLNHFERTPSSASSQPFGFDPKVASDSVGVRGEPCDAS